MKKHLCSRILSLVLAAVMVLGLVPAVSASPVSLRWRESDVEVSLDRSDRLIQSELHGMTDRKPTDMVRVSIVLEDAPTMKAGYSTDDIAVNRDARAYDLELQRHQQEMADVISVQALGGRELDVVWNLTLATNIISANIPWGKLNAVKAVEGVRDVVVECRYETEEVEQQTYNSAGMVGATTVWQTGLTGAGTRIAIIDTGTDTDHQSFDNGAYRYALEQNAAAAGVSVDAYLDSLDLLDVDDIDAVLKNLNAYERIGNQNAGAYYLNEKLPFGANYVDYNLTIDHDTDYQGSHGSHVAGIAAANRYIQVGNSYEDARQAVGMSGVAPDAQLITLKVFGANPGPYDSDYFAAIEDAIWLGCDSVNLSLGTGAPGYSENYLFEELLDYMATTDTVVVMSAGNSGYWAENTAPGYLYNDGVSFQMNGTPGSYTNPLTVASVDNGNDAADYKMSAFSSWGVPGSLELKPEITAPGGMILSVNGMDPTGTGYEQMSGTSMAAPQVTGMAALVASHIQSRGLDDQTGLSVRHLAQSLLMSTAVPLHNGASGGQYYSVLNQGAGLARVDLAAAAESYVMVNGMPDGKVKAELGEDPQREGTYTFSFSIHNLNGQAMTYGLSADLFTQDLFSDSNDDLCMDTWTRALDADASFFQNGISLECAGDGFSCDLDGSGTTNAADADFLLEYLLGNESELAADGDVNGDGEVTTYDAHVLLNRLTGAYSVDVPAGGSVTVEVRLELTEETKEYLDTDYPAGAYVEGYVFAVPVKEPEAKEAVSHSIPVLGFYGSWSEPSMYDVGGYLEHTSGAETRIPYLYDVNDIRSNFMSVSYGDGYEYVFGGNPITEEAVYLPERNAFNNQNGAMLQDLHFTQIRNAGNTMLLVENADTGAVLERRELGRSDGAYYHNTTGVWQNSKYKLDMKQSFAGIPEGTHLTISLICAPELYCTYDENGNVTTDWDKVAAGGYLTTELTIDNTAPVMKDVQVDDSGTLKVTARDNAYIAAVALMNPSGTSVLAAAAANQTQRGAQMTCELDLGGVYGKDFLVAVYDYAENVTVYEISLELQNQRPYFTAFDQTNEGGDGTYSYVGMESDGSTVRLADNTGRKQARAAEYVEGMIFEITVDNKLYVASNDDLYNFTYIADLDPTGAHQIYGFNDLAYNRADGKLYGIFYSTLNDLNMPYLCTIDLFSGEMTVLGEMPIDAYSMAIDGEGNFYSSIYLSSQLYTYKSDVTKTQKTTFVGMLDGYKCTSVNSMAWDHNTDELYWACTGNGVTTLLKVDPKTAKTAFIGYFDYATTGLFIAYESDSDLFAPTNRVKSVSMPAAASTLVDNTIQLTAQVRPWNVSDHGLIWTSSNAAVATVDGNGLVTGHAKGTAVITAASVLDKSKSASCTVTVDSLSTELKGVVWDVDGMVHWASFSTDKLPDYKILNTPDPNLPINATMIVDGVLYASTLDVSQGTSELYTVDPNSFRANKVGASSIAYVDMAYAPSLGSGLAVYNNYVMLVDLESGDYIGAWDWGKELNANLVGITYYGTQYNSSYNANMDYFLILDSDGNVYLDSFINAGNNIGFFNGPQDGYLKTIGRSVESAYFQGFYYDGAFTYWTRFNEADNVVELIAWDIEGTGNVYSMGYFEAGVWPVGGLYTDGALTGGRALIEDRMETATLRSAELMTHVEPTKCPGTAKVKPMSAAQVTEGGDIAATVTMPEGSTNGRLTVSFDASKLELTNVEGRTEAFAWKRSSAGKLEIAFADRKALTGDYAVLRFKALEKDGETAVHISYTELGDGSVELNEQIQVTLPSSFTDVPAGSFYEAPVIWAVKNGITTGATATTFNPNGNCQRAQVVSFLWRSAGSPEPTSAENPFTDVKESDFYYKAVLWAVENGITNGLTADTFGPFALCNRAQVVTFLWRAMEEPVVASGERPFTDVDPSEWYGSAVLWAVENGITNGMGDGTFGVGTTCNRAQVVTFLYRTMAS